MAKTIGRRLQDLESRSSGGFIYFAMMGDDSVEVRYPDDTSEIMTTAKYKKWKSKLTDNDCLFEISRRESAKEKEHDKTG